jgi:hypothetical protein
MKLYGKKPDRLIRVNISRPGDVTRHLAFYECNLSECFSRLMEYVHANISGEHKTMLQCREWTNSKNGASMSFSFMGPSLDEVEELINKI